jgi:hypothetical protein
LFPAGCRKGSPLRGTTSKSGDGQTYLSIDDDNGGGCPILVDGKAWRFKRGTPGPVASGEHTVSFKCGKGSSQDYPVTVPDGATFHFEYWGP